MISYLHAVGEVAGSLAGSIKIGRHVILLAGCGLIIAAAASACATRPGPSAARGPGTPGRATVYVVSQGPNTVTPVVAATGTAGRPVKLANGPDALAMGRDGQTVWVVSTSRPGFVTPIRTATNTASGRIGVGELPFDVAVTPDGKTAWVVNYKTVTPVDTGTGRAGRSIRLGLGVADHANAIVISPDGRTAYVAAASTVVPIHLAHRRAGKPIRLGNLGWAGSRIVITPDGRKLYVLTGSDLVPMPVIPVNTVTGKAGRPITGAGAASALAMAPDGKTVYAGSVIGKGVASSSVVVPVSTSTNKPRKPIGVGRPGPNAGVRSLAVTPSGKKVYVAANAAVYPVDTRTREVGQPIRVAPHGYLPTVLAISPDGRTAWVVSVNYNSGSHAGLLTPISISTNRAGKPIRVGKGPVCLLITTSHPNPRPEQGSCSFVFR